MPNSQEAMTYVNSFNAIKRKAVPEFLRRQSKDVYICNIYPWAHQARLGSLGTFYVPACAPGKPYSAPCVVPNFIADEYPLADGQGTMSWTAEEGRKVAEDVVGMHSYHNDLGPMTTNIEWWGVF